MKTRTTKGKKIEGTARVSWVGSWMPTLAWESPAAKFVIDGETFEWRASDESVIPGLHVGDTVYLRAFARINGNLYRVSVSCLPKPDEERLELAERQIEHQRENS